MWFRFLLGMIFLLVSATAQASSLGDFEKSATTDRDEFSDSSSSGSSERCAGPQEDDSLSCSLLRSIFSIVADVTKAAVVIGISESHARAKGITESERGLVPRLEGEPLIPMARLDLAYQHIDADLSSLDGRIELGKGPWALQSRMTSFYDRSADERMNFAQFHAVMRLSFGNHFSLNPGVGLVNLSGQDSHWGGSLALPMYWHFHPNVGLELINAYGVGDVAVDDKDYGVLISYKNTSVKLGLRRLISPAVTLSGYYVGLSYRY